MFPKGPCAQVAVNLLVLLREAKTSRRWGTVRGMRGCLKGCWNPGPFFLPAAMRRAVPSVMSSYHDNLPCHRSKAMATRGQGLNPLKSPGNWSSIYFQGCFVIVTESWLKQREWDFQIFCLMIFEILTFQQKMPRTCESSSHKSRMKEIN